MGNIKNLIWVGFGSRGETAETNFGSYFIFFDNDGIKWSSSFNRKHGVCENAAKAKEYCQQDFEKRILENIQ